MRQYKWNFQGNPFESATVTSYIRAYIIGTFTNAALTAANGDPIIAALLAFFTPYFQTYKTAYNAWQLQMGAQKGKTVSVKDLLTMAPAKTQVWEAEVIGSGFVKGSPQYTAIFPQGASGLYRGKQEEVINKYQTFGEALTANGVTSAGAEATAYYNSMLAANALQEGAKSTTTIDSTAVEAARVNMCNALYYVLGGLMQKYYLNTDPIAAFFNLQLIRNRPQTIFTGHIAATTISNIAKRTLTATAEVTLFNGGMQTLYFYLAVAPDMPAPTSAVAVAAGQSITVPASALGDTDTDTYLTVSNPGITAGVWEVDI